MVHFVFLVWAILKRWQQETRSYHMRKSYCGRHISSSLRTDDTIAVLLDTFHDRRNSYMFRVNPLGTKYDAEIRNERQVNSDWDERWDAAVTVTAEGWFAEFRIPLASLRYNTGSHVWGIDFKREVRRKNEEVTWSNYRRGFQINNISQAGNLVGLRDLGLTGRFRFQPYITGSGSQFNVTDEPFNEADGSIGLEDFKVQITPNLTADQVFKIQCRLSSMRFFQRVDFRSSLTVFLNRFRSNAAETSARAWHLGRKQNTLSALLATEWFDAT